MIRRSDELDWLLKAADIKVEDAIHGTAKALYKKPLQFCN